jgi:hypothetical protein
MALENDTELKKIAGGMLPPDVVVQLREAMQRKGLISAAAKKGLAEAQPVAKEEFDKLFNENSVKVYVENFFEEHMKSMILGFIGFEDSWHSGLQPKSHDFNKTAMYRFFQDKMEATAKQFFLEHFSDRMQDLKLTQKSKDKIVSSYRNHLEWELERLVHEKAKEDARKIFSELMGVEPSDESDDD